MVNTICFCDLLKVLSFKILLWPMDKVNCYNGNASKPEFFNLFHLETKKEFLKEVKAQHSLFLFLCYLQRLFIDSASGNHKLKNTVLVVAFHLAPLTLQAKKKKKKMLSTSANVVSEVSFQTLFCFHAITKHKRLRIRFRKKIPLMLLFVQVTAKFH